MTARGECDCCGEYKDKLFRLMAYGIETYACAECADILDEDDEESASQIHSG